MRYLFSFLIFFSSLCAWEVNTHRAIDRCALSSQCGEQRSLNLYQFAYDAGIVQDNYQTEIFEGYSTENGAPASYFSYIVKNGTTGESYGVSKWTQSFKSYGYQDLIEAGTILEDALNPGVNMYVWGNNDPNNGNGRFNNHFYDPQDDGAGLSIVPGFASTNAIDWAFDSTENAYSYVNALNYFEKGETIS